MKKATCCTVPASAGRSISTKAADGEAHPSSGRQRRFTLAKLSMPALILALLPKCPACFAAYVALGTGVSVSLAAASFLRTLLVGICMASLVWILASTFRSMLMKRLRPDDRFY